MRGYYRKYGRDLPWRKAPTPYRVAVSEVMLQQTQVSRVMRYYPKFIEAFPDWRSLATSPSKKILAVWQGLGYNRRALNLQRMAREVTGKYGGRLPKNLDDLAKLPGIGRATAGAILVYAYNLPVPYIETNIRRTFIHRFFEKKKTVSDRDILPLVELTLDRTNPRAWYSALMDYGTALGRSGNENPNRRSARYAKQSRFEGSRRQMRGRILNILLTSPKTATDLARSTGATETDLASILAELSREGFIRKRGNTYAIH
jgi:A/G-specific adenine glycosylase